MEKTTKSERRKFPRVCARISATVFAQGLPPLQCIVEDLSAGGALMSAPVRLEHDGPLRVRLKLLSGREISTTANVVRRERNDDGRCVFAVAFRDLSSAMEDTIQSAALKMLEAGGATVNVLVVDDDPVVRAGLARELRQLGARSHEAATPLMALACLNDRRAAIDVAVVDAHLEPADGVELLRHVAAEHPEVWRALVSGQLSPAEMMRAQISGIAQQVIAKPWEHDDLRRLLRFGS